MTVWRLFATAGYQSFHTLWLSVFRMRSKAWFAVRVSFQLARLPLTASSAQRPRRLRLTRAAAPALLAHAEVTKNIILFSMGPKLRYLMVLEFVLLCCVVCARLRRRYVAHPHIAQGIIRLLQLFKCDALAELDLARQALHLMADSPDLISVCYLHLLNHTLSFALILVQCACVVVVFANCILAQTRPLPLACMCMCVTAKQSATLLVCSNEPVCVCMYVYTCR